MTDILVVGGGVMGLLAARELRGRGLAVTLLERDRPGQQASWASAGIIGKTVHTSSDPFLALRVASTPLYPPLVSELEQETGIDVLYAEPGHLIPALREDEAAALEQQDRDLRERGEASEFVAGAALREREPALSERVIAARLEPGGLVDNRRLCQALDRSCRERGAEIRTGTVVTEVLQSGGRVSGVRTMAGDFAAPRVVIAAGSWSGQLRGLDPVPPVVPQRGQILALERRDVPLRRVIRTPNDPYIVPRPDGRVVIGATREHAGYEATYTAGGVAWLLQSAMELVPGLASSPIQEIWTGFRPLSVDGLPSIGPSNIEGLYYLTGHGPSGIAPAPASVALLLALMLNEAVPVPAEPYDPRRFAESSNSGR